MKRLNNKGFAISTLIYGLAIMSIMVVAILMSTMAQTRSNTKNLSQSIEDELNRFSKTETSFRATDGEFPTAQEYIVPESGWYKIELWGSQGGGNGGLGAYTSGVIELEEGEVLYFYVAKHRSSGSGRETDVRLLNGSYHSDLLSYETRIMVAAGGGSSTNADGGTLYGYNANMKSVGGFINASSADKDFSLLPSTETANNTNGTLIGLPNNYSLSGITYGNVGTAVSSPLGTNGGGDGFIPSNTSTTGGVSFIAGYAGGYGVSKGKITSSPIFEYYEHVYDTENDSYKYANLKNKYYFVDGIMLPGTNSGDGFAKIERVLIKRDQNTQLPRKNTKLNNVAYIKDCLKESANTNNLTWSKISAISEGIDVAASKTITQSTEGSNKCATVALGRNYNLDELATFHKTDAGIDYVNNTILVSSNGSNWQYVKNIGNSSDLSETEMPTGNRISAYQYDQTTSLPNSGNYIILPVLSENKIVTGDNTVFIDYYKGYKKQKWSIELNQNDISPANPGALEYRIIELSKYKALSITQNNNVVFNTLSTNNSFNKSARYESQIWKIEPVGNNTYTIKTVITSNNNTGLILPQTNQSISNNKNKVIIGKNNITTARFKLISIDYSSN